MMLHAELKVNGKVYLGIGRTHTEARQNAQQLISDNIGSGFACIIRPSIKVTSGDKLPHFFG